MARLTLTFEHRMVSLLFLVHLQQVAATDDIAGYTLLGQDANCRGPAGTNEDKVISKYKGSMTVDQCAQECNDNSASCKGFGYNPNTDGGQCIIYGPGFAGSCSDTNAGSPTACAALGTCSDSSKTSEETCGVCSGDAPDKTNCEDVISETWTAGTWTPTPGTWTGPTDGWAYEWPADLDPENPSTIVAGTTPSVGWKCYDADPYDHHPKCAGTPTDSTIASCEFSNTLTMAEKTSTVCPAGCVYTKAVRAPKATVFHAKVTKVDGWEYYSGVCRSGPIVDPAEYIRPDTRDSNTAGAGGVPATNEECMQACVDAGDVCTGYAHSTAWCILYGEDICNVPAELSASTSEGRYKKTGWEGYCEDHDDHTITQRKPNSAYICVVKGPTYGTVPATTDNVDPTTSSTDRRGIMVALFSLWLACFFQ